jgi:hypothetical protein
MSPVPLIVQRSQSSIAAGFRKYWQQIVHYDPSRPCCRGGGKQEWQHPVHAQFSFAGSATHLVTVLEKLSFRLNISVDLDQSWPGMAECKHAP